MKNSEPQNYYPKNLIGEVTRLCNVAETASEKIQQEVVTALLKKKEELGLGEDIVGLKDVGLKQIRNKVTGSEKNLVSVAEKLEVMRATMVSVLGIETYREVKRETNTLHTETWEKIIALTEGEEGEAAFQELFARDDNKDVIIIVDRNGGLKNSLLIEELHDAFSYIKENKDACAIQHVEQDEATGKIQELVLVDKNAVVKNQDSIMEGKSGETTGASAGAKSFLQIMRRFATIGGEKNEQIEAFLSKMTEDTEVASFVKEFENKDIAALSEIMEKNNSPEKLSKFLEGELAKLSKEKKAEVAGLQKELKHKRISPFAFLKKATRVVGRVTAMVLLAVTLTIASITTMGALLSLISAEAVAQTPLSSLGTNIKNGYLADSTGTMTQGILRGTENISDSTVVQIAYYDPVTQTYKSENLGTVGSLTAKTVPLTGAGGAEEEYSNVQYLDNNGKVLFVYISSTNNTTAPLSSTIQANAKKNIEQRQKDGTLATNMTATRLDVVTVQNRVAALQRQIDDLDAKIKKEKDEVFTNQDKIKEREAEKVKVKKQLDATKAILGAKVSFGHGLHETLFFDETGKKIPTASVTGYEVVKVWGMSNIVYGVVLKKTGGSNTPVKQRLNNALDMYQTNKAGAADSVKVIPHDAGAKYQIFDNTGTVFSFADDKLPYDTLSINPLVRSGAVAVKGEPTTGASGEIIYTELQVKSDAESIEKAKYVKAFIDATTIARAKKTGWQANFLKTLTDAGINENHAFIIDRVSANKVGTIKDLSSNPHCKNMRIARVEKKTDGSYMYWLELGPNRNTTGSITPVVDPDDGGGGTGKETVVYTDATVEQALGSITGNANETQRIAQIVALGLGNVPYTLYNSSGAVVKTGVFSQYGNFYAAPGQAKLKSVTKKGANYKEIKIQLNW